MAKWLSILFLVAVTCLAGSQDRPASATKESAQSNCELTQDDYAVFGALLLGLDGPEHPEEAWQGKEMLIASVTVTPYPEKQANSGWGVRSKSSAAPSQETFSDYVENAHSACIVKPKFGDPNSYRIVPREEIDNFFKKGGGWWQEFYKKTQRVLDSGNSHVLATTLRGMRHYSMSLIPAVVSVAPVICTCSQNRAANGKSRIA